MLGQTNRPQKPQMAYQPAQQDDAKKAVSEILKRVDQLIHKGDLDHAQIEITKAKKVDPRNIYIWALEERVSLLQSEFNGSQDSQQKKESTSFSPTEHFYRTEDVIQQKPITDTPNPATVLSASTEALSLLHHETENKTEDNRENDMHDRSIELKSYRKALIDAWCDGALTENEERRLSDLRTLFDITDADCDQMERKVKYECYQNALLQQLNNHSMNVSSSILITDLQRMFHITEEEHLSILTQLPKTVQHTRRDKLLLIDDDTRLLELLAASMENNGFDVTAVSTSDEAYMLLRKLVPDVILCDINLGTSTMSGFTFYEKIQELKNIQGIPFIFLTGFTDESLLRTGKELGADDYLLKPISEQVLVSALRGKLKRFKQLKDLMTAPMHTMAAA
jgi:CheY-like chemotaxis protein